LVVAWLKKKEKPIWIFIGIGIVLPLLHDNYMMILSCEKKPSQFSV